MPLSQNELVWLYLTTALEDAGMEEILGDENVYGDDGFILTVGDHFVIHKEFSGRIGRALGTDFAMLSIRLDTPLDQVEVGRFRTPWELAEGVVLLLTSYSMKATFEKLEDTIGANCSGSDLKKWKRAQLGPKGEKNYE